MIHMPIFNNQSDLNLFVLFPKCHIFAIEIKQCVTH